MKGKWIGIVIALTLLVVTSSALPAPEKSAEMFTLSTQMYSLVVSPLRALIRKRMRVLAEA